MESIKKRLMYYLRVGGSLFLIAAFIGLLLALVNSLTREKISGGEDLEVLNAISALFENSDPPVKIDGDYSYPIDTAYVIEKDGQKAGYCVKVSPKSFKDVIVMVVGTDTSGKCIGVKITYINETIGFGSKVAEASYIDSYIGKSAGILFGKDIDSISGATSSSKSVYEGVNAALVYVAENLAGKGGSPSLPETAPADSESPPISETSNGGNSLIETEKDSSAETTSPPATTREKETTYVTESINVTKITIPITTTSPPQTTEPQAETTGKPDETISPPQTTAVPAETTKKPESGETSQTTPATGSDSTPDSSSQTEKPPASDTSSAKPTETSVIYMTDTTKIPEETTSPESTKSETTEFVPDENGEETSG